MNEAGDAPTISREEDSVSRRSFLGVLLGFGGVVIGAALSVPLLRFALHPLLTKTTEIGWSDIGKIEEFASLTAPLKKLITVAQRDGWRKIVSEKAIYVLPIKDGVVRVLSPICPTWAVRFRGSKRSSNLSVHATPPFSRSMAPVFPVQLRDRWTILRARSTTAC